jgi:hypothetical protein
VFPFRLKRPNHRQASMKSSTTMCRVAKPSKCIRFAAICSAGELLCCRPVGPLAAVPRRNGSERWLEVPAEPDRSYAKPSPLFPMMTGDD